MNTNVSWTGEMAQWFQVLAVLTEDMGEVPSTYMVAQLTLIQFQMSSTGLQEFLQHTNSQRHTHKYTKIEKTLKCQSMGPQDLSMAKSTCCISLKT